MSAAGDSPEVFKQSFPSLQNLRISAQPAIRFRIREFWRPFSAFFSTPFLSTPSSPIPLLALFFDKKPIFIL